MSTKDFKPRRVVRSNLSSNPKTARNRAAETSKRGFEAAELKAKTAYRVNKSRALGKLHKSSGWDILSSAEKGRREQDALEEVEDKFSRRMPELHRE